MPRPCTGLSAEHLSLFHRVFHNLDKTSGSSGPSFPALHRRMETTLVSPKALAVQAAEALLHLQLPPSEEYHVGRKYLTFPTAQRQRLNTAALAWLEVLKTDIPKNLNGHLFAALQYWLQERQTAITTAISQRTALYSDALLLGIVSCELATHGRVFLSQLLFFSR